jgi:hypothetical protein
MTDAKPERKPQLLLTGKLTQRDYDAIEILHLCARHVRGSIRTIKDKEQRLALTHIVTALDSTYTAIGCLCCQDDKHPQPIAALLRTMIEAMISTLAFCDDPQDGACRYKFFLTVLQWKWSVLDMKYSGWFMREGHPEGVQRLQATRNRAVADILQHGTPFLKKPNYTVEDAVAKDDIKAFDDKWFKQNRKRLLDAKRLGLVYDIWYSRLSSSVHSDAAAAPLLGGESCSDILSIASRMYHIGLWSIVDTFHFGLPSQLKGILNKTMKEFQYP